MYFRTLVLVCVAKVLPDSKPSAYKKIAKRELQSVLADWDVMDRASQAVSQLCPLVGHCTEVPHEQGRNQEDQKPLGTR